MDKSRTHCNRIIKQSMRDLNQVCLKHTELTYRRIYNWLRREGVIMEDDIYYLRNPIDACDILFTEVSWERIGRDYTPHLKQWDQNEFLEDVKRVTEPGREAMWHFYELDETA